MEPWPVVQPRVENPLQLYRIGEGARCPETETRSMDTTQPPTLSLQLLSSATAPSSSGLPSYQPRPLSRSGFESPPLPHLSPAVTPESSPRNVNEGGASGEVINDFVRIADESEVSEDDPEDDFEFADELKRIGNMTIVGTSSPNASVRSQQQSSHGSQERGFEGNSSNYGDEVENPMFAGPYPNPGPSHHNSGLMCSATARFLLMSVKGPARAVIRPILSTSGLQVRHRAHLALPLRPLASASGSPLHSTFQQRMPNGIGEQRFSQRGRLLKTNKARFSPELNVTTREKSKTTRKSCHVAEPSVLKRNEEEEEIDSSSIGELPVKEVEPILMPTEEIPKATVEVPKWRIHPMIGFQEGDERPVMVNDDMSDDAFRRRHQKLETQEKRRNRWDSRIIREERYREKMKRKEEEREQRRELRCQRKRKWRGSCTSEDQQESPLPRVENIQGVFVSRNLPVGFVTMGQRALVAFRQNECKRIFLKIITFLFSSYHPSVAWLVHVASYNTNCIQCCCFSLS